MSRYVALVDGEPGAYGVVFPDAPGCTAMGDTIEEALLNARETLGEWIAVVKTDAKLSVPKVRTVDELLKDKEVVEDIKATKAVIAYVPAIVETKKFTRANLSIDTGVLESIDKEAASVGMTRSSFLVSAALEKIKAGY